MKLNDAMCRAAKGGEKLYKLSDGGGLQLWVHPTGTRTWRLAYRYDGKQKNLTLGTYPDMRLVEARELREKFKRLLREGHDPAQPQKLETEVETKFLFQQVADEWFENVKSAWVESHQLRIYNRLKNDVFPTLGDTDIREIKAPDVLKVLRAIEDRGAIDMAKRVRLSVSNIFTYAVGAGIVEYDPTINLNTLMKPNPRVQHHAYITSEQMPEFLKALDNFAGNPITRLAITFTMQTMVRTGETRFARWDEFEDLDTDKPLWRIPAERMKRHLPHQVPLSTQTVILLREIAQFNSGSEYLFSIDTKNPISENTMIYGLYRMGYHSRATIHGLRRTASTILNESNLFNPDWIERQLAHVDNNKIRLAYNAAEWLPQRREMLQWYNDFIDSCRK